MAKLQTSIATLVALAALAAFTAAQSTPELRKLDGLVGTWQGAGTLHDRPWTSRVAARWLDEGKHVLREDTILTLEGVPVRFAMSSFFFLQNHRIAIFVVNQIGGATLATATWSGDELVVINDAEQEGQRVVSRNVLAIAPDKITNTGIALRGAEDPAVTFRGNLTRTSAAWTDLLSVVVAGDAPTVGGEPVALNHLIGRYELEGEHVNGEIAISRFLNGGGLELRSSIGGVKGTQILGWTEAGDPLLLDFNSNGFACCMQAQFIDGDLVAVAQAVAPEVVGIWRWVLDVEAERVVGLRSDSLTNAQRPTTVALSVKR